MWSIWLDSFSINQQNVLEENTALKKDMKEKSLW